MENQRSVMTSPEKSFPIFILDDDSLGALRWKELLPEAKIVLTEEELLIDEVMTDNVRGALVITASTRTTLTRELLLDYVNRAVQITTIRSYNGFYLDNLFNPYPLTTLIDELTPLVFLQLASVRKGSYRSYWISSTAIKRRDFNLQGQFYPALVVVSRPYPTQEPSNLYLLILLGVLLLIGIIFWLVVLAKR